MDQCLDVIRLVSLVGDNVLRCWMHIPVSEVGHVDRWSGASGDRSWCSGMAVGTCLTSSRGRLSLAW